MEYNKLENREILIKELCGKFFTLKTWEGHPDFDLSEFVKESAGRVVLFRFRDGLL